MPAVHIGDAWIMETGTHPIPDTNTWIVLGVVPAESYHGTFTANVQWIRPASGPVTFPVEFDLDGYSTLNGQPLDGGDGRPEFNSNLYPRQQEVSQETYGAGTVVWPFVDQALMDVPANCELRLRMKAPSGYSATLVNCKLVMQVVVPK